MQRYLYIECIICNNIDFNKARIHYLIIIKTIIFMIRGKALNAGQAPKSGHAISR